MRGVRDRVLVRTRAAPLSGTPEPAGHKAMSDMAARKKPGPLVCAKCGKVIPAGEGHMRAPDLKAYHVDCYDGRDSRARYRPRR